MKSVHNKEFEMIVNKSRFIALSFYIDNIFEIEEKIEFCKKKYKLANHYCYAYIIDNHEKMYDDGEPVGTAGMPILNILKKEKLNNVLCVVIRYFGGIKLGAGGLIRAYGSACKNSLDIKELKPGILISICFSYEHSKQIDYLLKNCQIINKIYTIDTIYEVEVDNCYYEEIATSLKNISEVKIIKNIYI